MRNTSLRDIDGEIWESVSEFDGYYEVSNFGRVKSVERLVPWRDTERLIKPRILKQGLNAKNKPTRYYQVGLSREGQVRVCPVHRLVADAFLGGDKGLFVLHNNGDTLDNRASNLRYDTPNAKAQQAWDIGHQISPHKGKYGADSHSAKPIVMCDMTGNVLLRFPARIAAAEWLINKGLAPAQQVQNIISCINRAANGVTNHSYGHKWTNETTTKS